MAGAATVGLALLAVAAPAAAATPAPRQVTTAGSVSLVQNPAASGCEVYVDGYDWGGNVICSYGATAFPLPGGRIEVVAVAPSHVVWTRWSKTSSANPASGLNPWTGVLGGLIYSGLDAAVYSDGTVIIDGIGGNGNIFYDERYAPNGPWSGWYE
ncbi:MAG: hypothetical protein M3Y42_09640 [Actinomycetota bacterium]|nr:hypothetical protein [Actinomycetota bacterium]MDQ2957213.1 hypothetical protein [Actinomycetota bacterium]